MTDTTKILEELKGKIPADQYDQLKLAMSRALLEKPRAGLGRIPLLLPLLGGFGLVSTFYGFEKLLDQTALVNHPLVLISTGIILLLLTGAFAKNFS